MKHERFYLSLEEWFDEEPKKTPVEAMSRALQCFTERGFLSFERELSALLDGYLGCSFDQMSVPTRTPKARSHADDEVYVTCLKLDSTMVFIDIDRFSVTPDRRPEPKFLEADIFADDEASLAHAKERVVDEAMRCFGLTKAKETLLSSVLADASFAKHLRDRLTFEPPMDEQLFQRLREEKDRSILRELKKRGSVLERDVHELASRDVEAESVKRLLDYLSGEEYQLIDRKYAIVCRAKDEIVFRYRSKEDFVKAQTLECPQCSKLLGEELIMNYYGVTDGLRLLMDGNRWMPLMARDALIAAGVSRDDIYTEVKHGEDEIDVLFFFRDRVIVVELKNRPVNLNDAYKLSAKTSKIESVITRVRSELRFAAEEDDDILDYIPSGDYARRFAGRTRRSRAAFIPLIISTHDIAKDAQNLLKETNDAALFLENSDGKMENFLSSIVEKINSEDLNVRLQGLTGGGESGDSVASLAARQVQRSFTRWRRSRQGDKPAAT
jgi:hypothetical protein